QSITVVCLHGLCCSSRAPKYRFCMLTWVVLQVLRPKVSLLYACMARVAGAAPQSITFVRLHGSWCRSHATKYRFYTLAWVVVQPSLLKYLISQAINDFSSIIILIHRKSSIKLVFHLIEDFFI